MATVENHYENLLADVYTWTLGGPEVKIEENRRFLEGHQIVPRLSKQAVDLGAGSGFQSITLAEKGFQVTAIDWSQKLLNELIGRKNQLDITPICDNLLNFTVHVSSPLELIVCMGDTLTHLESLEQVELLFQKAYDALEKGGRLALTFRDLTTELKNLDRFIPVNSNRDTIFTCFLEYEPHHVKVHDLLYVWEKEKWNLKKSYYLKLRIRMDWVSERLTAIGFQSEVSNLDRGLITMIVKK
ncbi:MAG: class I SAM-dependent methyltransferase [Candidatus Omnitrophota bacterium]